MCAAIRSVFGSLPDSQWMQLVKTSSEQTVITGNLLVCDNNVHLSNRNSKIMLKINYVLKVSFLGLR